MPKMRVVLAYENKIMREGLKALLETEQDLEVVGEAADGRGVVDLVAQLDPDVLIIDLLLPDLNGLEVTRVANRRSPQVHIIALARTANAEYAEEALRQGAVGLILKETILETLVPAIRTVLSGEIYVSPPIAEQLRNIPISERPATHLSYKH